MRTKEKEKEEDGEEEGEASASTQHMLQFVAKFKSPPGLDQSEKVK